MKPPSTQTPRSVNWKSKETPSSKSSDSNKLKKIVAMCLNPDFSLASEDRSPNPTDPTLSSPESEIAVLDPDQKTKISFPASTLELEADIGKEEHGEIGSVTVKKADEEQIKVEMDLDLIRRTLAEIRRSDGGSKKLLDAVVEIVLEDLDCTPGKPNKSSNLVFQTGFRIGTLCFLILFVVVMTVSIVLFSHRCETHFSGLPPT